jgi:hypothetical protein
MKHYFIGFLISFAFIGTTKAQTFTVEPDSGHPLYNYIVTVNGTGTQFLSDTADSIGGLYIEIDDYGSDAPANVINDSLLTVELSVPELPPGWYNVDLYSNGGSSYLSSKPFYIGADNPIISTVSPISGHRGDKLNMVVGTQGIDLAQAVPSVMLFLDSDHYIVTHWQQISFDSIWATASIPDSAMPGIYDVLLVQDTLSATVPLLRAAKAFTVLSDSVISLPDNNSAQAGAAVPLHVGVHNRDLIQGKASATLVLDENHSIRYPADSITVTSDTTMTAHFNLDKSSIPGWYDIVINDIKVVKPHLDSAVDVFKIEAASGVSLASDYSGLIRDILASPNPANGNISISFFMTATSHVNLVLFDALGRTIETLCDQTISSGFHNFEWSSENVPAGSYFYELSAGEEMYGGRIVVQH